MADQVVAITVTEQQAQRLDAIIGEIKGFGSGWVILDELALAVWSALPVDIETA